jgi:hypothetical protein
MHVRGVVVTVAIELDWAQTTIMHAGPCEQGLPQAKGGVGHEWGGTKTQPSTHVILDIQMYFPRSPRVEIHQKRPKRVLVASRYDATIL